MGSCASACVRCCTSKGSMSSWARWANKRGTVETNKPHKRNLAAASKEPVPDKRRTYYSPAEQATLRACPSITATMIAFLSTSRILEFRRNQGPQAKELKPRKPYVAFPHLKSTVHKVGQGLRPVFLKATLVLHVCFFPSAFWRWGQTLPLPVGFACTGLVCLHLCAWFQLQAAC